MTRRFFGTDGIRGQANKYPMTAEMALKVAMATALSLWNGRGGLHQNRAVIGKDTRLSGYMLEEAMCAGFVSMGMDVVLVGPIPTPAISMLTRSMRADVGVMISASHNPYQDNGIKLFGADGHKLQDEIERRIEAKLESDLAAELASPDDLGKASRLDDASGRYIEFLKSSFPRRLTLEGMKVVIDCAHGAAYKVAPQILWELEADVIKIGVSPNGRNINEGCGATSTALLQKKVVEEKADLGIALDGDADRVILVDEKGVRVDGDQIMALLADTWRAQGRLQGGGIVSTVMSNLGLEKYLENQGVDLIRTQVGDRYVVDHMRQHGYNVGGEQSGHIVLSDYGATGDGLLAALQVLAVLKMRGERASKVLKLFEPYPQVLKSVRFDSGNPLERERVRQAISDAEQKLSGDGRLLVRMSGTEPVIRVMAEGADSKMVETVVGDVCLALSQDR